MHSWQANGCIQLNIHFVWFIFTGGFCDVGEGETPVFATNIGPSGLFIVSKETNMEHVCVTLHVYCFEQNRSTI